MSVLQSGFDDLNPGIPIRQILKLLDAEPNTDSHSDRGHDHYDIESCSPRLRDAAGTRQGGVGTCLTSDLSRRFVRSSWRGW